MRDIHRGVRSQVDASAILVHGICIPLVEILVVAKLVGLQDMDAIVHVVLALFIGSKFQIRLDHPGGVVHFVGPFRSTDANKALHITHNALVATLSNACNRRGFALTIFQVRLH